MCVITQIERKTANCNAATTNERLPNAIPITELMFTMLINISEGAQPAIKRSTPFTAQSVA